MSKNELVSRMIEAAKKYHDIERALQQGCREQFELDVESCVIYAKNGLVPKGIPVESAVSSSYLDEVAFLHRKLVQNFGMSNEAVRAIWYPIVNRP